MQAPKGWKLYFPNEEYKPDLRQAPLVKELTNWFRNQGRHLLRKVDFTHLYRACFEFEDLKRCPIDGFNWAVEKFPEETFAITGCAVFEALFAAKDPNDSEDLEPPPDRPIKVRFHNFEPQTAMRDLKSNQIGRFVSMKGTVIRVSGIKPVLVAMNFVCTKCGSESSLHCTDGKYDAPTTCATCKSKTIMPDRRTATTTDWQRVRIQEIVTDESREEGRMPRTVECELTDDLVDSCIPGDVVTVSGVVKVMSTDGEANGRSKNKCLFLLYIDAHSVSNSKTQSGDKGESFQFTSKELLAVNEIAQEPNLLPLIVNSVCPAIYGHEVIKMALALSLFGGCPKLGDEKNKLGTRADSHILIVGEPGLGKSQMLQAVSCLAPRGVYVCGNTTSTAGLTVTVTKDAVTGDFALEAGALVLGDQGVCCIDEFDKMSGEHQALLEAMEQQSISVAKAGIVCSLSARSSVIAAANPVGGHYNRAKTVNENLKMSRAIMSRFDLIFVLLDSPDADRDQLLSEHVMAIHRGGVPSRQGSLAPGSRGPEYKSQAAPSLLQRLQMADAEAEALPSMLLRKYIAYARKYCHPRLDSKARKVLQDFYLSLRKRKHRMDLTPVTTRQLEALVRLAEARAKLELREIITGAGPPSPDVAPDADAPATPRQALTQRLVLPEADAVDVVDLMKESLVDTLSDDLGGIDFGRSSGNSRNKESQRLVKVLTREAEAAGSNIFAMSEIKSIAAAHGIKNAEDLVESLNLSQMLLMKGGRKYELQTTSFS